MVQINPAFESLIPKLTTEELSTLEASIVSEGCRDPLVVWNDFIVDGHNRYRICTEHGIEFTTVSKEFESEDDAKIRMINNQFGRRNLWAFDRGMLALEMESIFSKKAKQNLSNGGKGCQISDKVDTKKELAKLAKVSHDTISKVKKIKEFTTDVKALLKKGDLTINQVFNDIKKDEKKAELKQKIQDSKDKWLEIPASITVLWGDFKDKIQEVADNSIDLLITDPPYWMDKWDRDMFKDYDDFYTFTYNWIRAILPKMKDKFNMFISFNSEYFSMLEWIIQDLNKLDVNLPIQSRLIRHYRNAWGKSSGKSMFSKTYEPILHIGNKDLNFSEEWTDERFDVWTIAVPQSNFSEGKYHPTQKPLELFSKLVVLWSNKWDTVLDCFAWSGTTWIVCKDLDRNCILIEKEQEFLDIINYRLWATSTEM
jgi:DNA modification methylase